MFSSTTSRAFIMVATALLFAVPAIEFARADIPDLMAQLDQLTAEQNRLVQEMEESLALRRQNEVRRAQLHQEGNRLDVEEAELERRSEAARRICTYECSSDADCAVAHARCNEVRLPLNERIHRHNA